MHTPAGKHMTHASAYSQIIGSTCETFTHNAPGCTAKQLAGSSLGQGCHFHWGHLSKPCFCPPTLGFSSQASYRLSSPAEWWNLLGLYATDYSSTPLCKQGRYFDFQVTMCNHDILLKRSNIFEHQSKIRE